MQQGSRQSLYGDLSQKLIKQCNSGLSNLYIYNDATLQQLSSIRITLNFFWITDIQMIGLRSVQRRVKGVQDGSKGEVPWNSKQTELKPETN